MGSKYRFEHWLMSQTVELRCSHFIYFVIQLKFKGLYNLYENLILSCTSLGLNKIPRMLQLSWKTFPYLNQLYNKINMFLHHYISRSYCLIFLPFAWLANCILHFVDSLYTNGNVSMFCIRKSTDTLQNIYI